MRNDSTLFPSASQKLSELLNPQDDNDWEKLIDFYSKDPRCAALIESPRLKGHWNKKYAELMPETSTTADEKQLTDPRHPFRILAGKFCAYKGWPSRKTNKEFNQRWFERGAELGDYLCCDRLCYLISKEKQSPERIQKRIHYGVIATKYHGALGYGLLTEVCIQTGRYFQEKLKPNFELMQIAYEAALTYLNIAVTLTPQSQHLQTQALTLHSKKTRFTTKAKIPIKTWWIPYKELEQRKLRDKLVRLANHAMQKKSTP